MQNPSPVSKIAEARPLARRPHLCSICGHPIAIGSRYDRIVLVDRTNVRKSPVVFKLHCGGCPSEVLDVR